MKWIEALRVWNTTSNCGGWTVPRKGTPEYLQVRELMARAKPEAVEARNIARRERALEQLRMIEAARKRKVPADDILARFDELQRRVAGQFDNLRARSDARFAAIQRQLD
jgi:hypothetical protein